MSNLAKILLGLLMLSILPPLNAQGIDFSGAWKGTWEYKDKSYIEEINLNLK